MAVRKKLPVRKLQEIVYAISRKIQNENLSVEDIVALTIQAIEVSKLLKTADRPAPKKKKPSFNDLFGENKSG